MQRGVLQHPTTLKHVTRIIRFSYLLVQLKPSNSDKQKFVEIPFSLNEIGSKYTDISSALFINVR